MVVGRFDTRKREDHLTLDLMQQLYLGMQANGATIWKKKHFLEVKFFIGK